MFELFANVLYMGAISVTQANLMVTQAVPPQELHIVSPIEMRIVTARWSADFECRLSGVAVSVDRDWDDEVETYGVKNVIPPELGKHYTYGIIVNKKTCPNKEPEHMLSTGSWTGAFKNLGVPEGAQFVAMSISPDKAKQPKWLPQASKLVADAAKLSPVVREFVAFSEQPKATSTSAEGKIADRK